MIQRPLYMENTGTGTIQFDIHSKLLENRIIMLFDTINDDTAETVIAQLLFLEALDPDRDIRIYINSPGGSVDAGLAIYDTMRHLRCDIATVCVGKAASMAAFLLAAGTSGKRYSLENSTILIHQVLSQVPFSQATDIQIRADHIQLQKNKVNALLAGMTGKTVAEICQDTERDHFMTPEQAMAYGLIDEVIKNEA